MKSLRYWLALPWILTWRLLTSSPLAFALGTIFLFLYFLVFWALLHYADWNNFGWKDHHLLIERLPRPPGFHIPLLGEPDAWSFEACMWSWIVMSIIWFGTVYLHKESSADVSNKS
jgi:hypothetical protein